MPQLIAIIGKPGTGKTTWVAERVVKLLERGVKPEEIAFASFSRAAAAAFYKRLEAKLGYTPTKEDFPHTGTLHSLAARLLGLHKGDFIENGDRVAFCKQKNLDYIPSYVRSIDEIEEYGILNEPYFPVEGNILFRWFQFLKRTLIYPPLVRQAIKKREMLTEHEREVL
ncbi:MAG: UvrD-helicase domain-containing protein, partial [Candidatus Methanospirareceae archaeon]